MSWITDAHIHLSDPEYSNEMPIILKSMERIKLRACCVSEDYQSSQRSLDLGLRSRLVLPFVGIHPQNANDDLEPVITLIDKNSQQIAGIGEIGMDKTYVSDSEGLQRQEKVFRNMLSIAEKLRKPVSIHSRATLDNILEILPSYSISGILLHWFAGSKKQLKTAMELGHFVSYGPSMVYAKDKQVLLAQTNNDRILVETDGPVKFGRCFGLKSAQITFLASVIFCAAKVLRKSYDDMSAEVEQNCRRYLGV